MCTAASRFIWKFTKAILRIARRQISTVRRKMQKIKHIQARIQSQTSEEIKVIISADFGLYDWKDIKINIPLKLFKSVYRTDTKISMRQLQRLHNYNRSKFIERLLNETLTKEAKNGE